MFFIAIFVALWVIFMTSAVTVNLFTTIRILNLLELNVELQEVLVANAQEVLAAVAELPTIEASLEELLTKLADLIAQGKQDPASLDQALSILTTFKDQAKAAILAGTPQAPTPPVEPPV